MGDYTELMLAIDLPDETPIEITDILAYLADPIDEIRPHSLPDDPFFQTGRWEYLFTMDSCYFNGITVNRFEWDKYSEVYHLTVRANLKNYSDEIDKFIHWICQYLKYRTLQFSGYFRFEADENPTLIYLMKGQVKYIHLYFDPEIHTELRP